VYSVKYVDERYKSVGKDGKLDKSWRKTAEPSHTVCPLSKPTGCVPQVVWSMILTRHV
jgi:hypothetical protein